MIEIYTDGACSGNPGPGGWGFVAVANNAAVHSESGGEADTTNNRMELMGAIRAFEFLQNFAATEGYQIVTDSKYVMDGATAWLPGWKRKNWIASNKKPVKNRDLWERLDALIIANPTVTWRWVKGHSNNTFNEMVDQIAVAAIPGGLMQAGKQ